jgi:hypothetical protein
MDANKGSSPKIVKEITASENIMDMSTLEFLGDIVMSKNKEMKSNNK